ncbi:thiamine-phosphate kinase [Solidesulfovibrio sp.]|uniref:thiamine-phosphate kinase n=1 Tax=Solidesulfovibrio sp. TaxID=2910990 RepID=UPI000EF0DC91|nr:thiamine-phosphate kinase [Solidesulfovibrio sp.]MEA5090664.1 thiamine-phosphate kinase [Solidesulfovibrio sp.]HCR14336.1 thiamine-phosphate kinase [Desulfovibrio sp.]HML61182.1 thiamine-phosphate kinase [Solidesulfovibrio sp.]
MTILRSEDDFLALIDRHFSRTGAGVELSRGDDAAILDWPGKVCVTTDLFLEDVHFRRAYFAPADVGYKALAVNISDVAAMGCRPLGFTCGLASPDDADREYWEEAMAGMAALAREFGVPLVGGDLSRADKIGISISIWGEAGPAGRFLRRGLSAPGDVLFVAGPIGLARVGLAVLEKEGLAGAAQFPAAVAAHLRPVPQVAAGLALAAVPEVSACMDVSDGLVRDLPRLLPAGLGADLFLPPALLHPEVTAHAAGHGRKPEKEAVFGGEDYALLGSVSPAGWPAVRAAVPEAAAIGMVSPKNAFTLNGAPLNMVGFDHFG